VSNPSPRAPNDRAPDDAPEDLHPESLLLDGPAEARVRVILAHGAGAAMDTSFMSHFARGLAAAGHRVVRFEFPYMAARRRDGKRRPPDGQAKLLEHWKAIIADQGGARQDSRLVIGGKSLGGRMASLIADQVGAAGLVCLGYPFHPAGKPDKLRTAHLETLETPSLFVQGTRDALGSRDEVAGYRLSPAIRLHWAEDGDHSLVPRKASGRSAEQNWDEAVSAIADFIVSL